jgi:hypothetical protein
VGSGRPAPTASNTVRAVLLAGSAVMRAPQCWQNAKPAGVCFPHEPQLIFTDPDGPLIARAAGAAIRPLSAADTPGAFGSGVPQVLQKFIPGLLAVPQLLQRTVAGAGAGAAASTARRVPHSWQNCAPSLFTFPHLLQRGIVGRL